MKRLLLLFGFLTMLNFSYAQLKFMSGFPFKLGEKMLFSIKVLGIYIGDQQIFLEDMDTYEGKKVLVGSGQTFTTPEISAMYKVDDSERSWFSLDEYKPLYYERWVNEGDWHNHIRFKFHPEQNKVDIFEKVNNYNVRTLSYPGILRNYFTLIACMRAVDYEYHIANHINVEIDYLFGTAIKKAVFKPSYQKLRFNNRDMDVIFLDEVGGIGMNFYIQNDSRRTPVKLVIPAFQLIGFKTINIDVELREYTPGSTEIPR